MSLFIPPYGLGLAKGARLSLAATPAVYTATYGYDANDDLTSLTDPAGKAFSFFYDQRGGLKATLYPNGTFSWNDYLPAS